MKNISVLMKSLPALLALSVSMLANFFTGQPAQAAARACSVSSIHGGLITADETWCKGGDDTHYIHSNVIVQPGVTLTIAAGVKVTSATSDWWQYLIVQGHLDIQGTAAEPVLLTHANPDNTWGGLYFDGTAGDGSGNINHAIIERAGANLGGYSTVQHAILVKDLGPGRQVTINNSTLRDNISKGLYVVNSTVSVTNTSFSQHRYPILIEGASSVVTYAGNTFANNGYPYYDNNGNYTVPEDAIFMSPGALMDQDFSLPAQTGLDAYIFMSGTTIPAGRTVTVQPGQTLRTGAGYFLTVKGFLTATGTAGQPIRITGIPHKDTLTDVLGWGGLVFDGREGAGAGHMDYVTLEKGGDNLTEYGPYNLLVRNTPAPGQVLVEHSTIQDAYGFGVRVIDGNLALNNNTFLRNNWPVQIEGAASQVSLMNNTFTSNTNNYVYVTPNAMTGHNINLTLQTGLDAYYFTGTFTVPNGKTLTVQPGVVIRMDQSRFLIIQGDLQAIGTAAQPVRFSDPNTNNYTWGGLIFDGPAGASGRIEHAIIEHGCDWWNGQFCANLVIYNLAANKSVVVEHSTLQNSILMNLAVINSPTAQVDANLIKAGRIGVYFSGNKTVSNLALIDQEHYGMIVETGSTVEARHLTIARAGIVGLHVHTGATASLKNSILSHNALAVWGEGTGQATIDTFLNDTNTTFKSGNVTQLSIYTGVAAFEADGYHIQAASAAVGRGLAGLCDVDIDGNGRAWPVATHPDLGADEIAPGRYFVFMPGVLR